MDPMLFLFLFIFLPFCFLIFLLKLIDEIKNIPTKFKYYRNKISSFIHNPRILVPEKNLKFITLFAAVVKCDGRVRHKEIEFVKKHIFLSSQFNKYREESIRFFDSEIEDINVRFIGYKTTKVPFFILDRKNMSGECISEKVSDISANLFSTDLLSANASEKEKEEATARFRSIHEAYEFLLSLEMVRVK